MGGIDARFDQPHELVEDRILQGDWKRQDAIEPALDRRKIIDHRPVGCFAPEDRQLLHAPEADSFKLPGEQQTDPALDRILVDYAVVLVGPTASAQTTASGQLTRQHPTHTT